jgi:predicted transcriptional regulator
MSPTRTTSVSISDDLAGALRALANTTDRGSVTAEVNAAIRRYLVAERDDLELLARLLRENRDPERGPSELGEQYAQVAARIRQVGPEEEA